MRNGTASGTAAATAEIADAKRVLWADPEMLIELAGEIRERTAREAAVSSPATPISAPRMSSAPAA